jgi:Cu(I)/Ag(I) efflux system membrane fusion protein
VQKALAADQAKQAVQEAKRALDAVAAVDMTLASGQAHMDWMKQAEQLRTILSQVVEAKDIEAVRKDFALLSELMATTAKRFKGSSQTLYQFKCPMAFDNRGATWLQADEEIANPYFGKMMPGCGDLIEAIPGEKQPGGHDHG